LPTRQVEEQQDHKEGKMTQPQHHKKARMNKLCQ